MAHEMKHEEEFEAGLMRRVEERMQIELRELELKMEADRHAENQALRE